MSRKRLVPIDSGKCVSAIPALSRLSGEGNGGNDQYCQSRKQVGWFWSRHALQFIPHLDRLRAFPSVALGRKYFLELPRDLALSFVKQETTP
jgi:hypothetical protein